MGLRGWSLLTLIVVSAGLGTLFWVQNSLRTVDLSLDLYVVAFKLASPVSVPVLLGATLVLGVLVGAGMMVLARRPPAPASVSASGSSGGGDLWT